MKKKIIGILGIITLLVALLIPASAVFAQDVVVSIDAPAEVDADTDFTAAVDIADVENFDAAQYDVVFDDTVLRLDDVTAGTIDGTAIPVVSNLVDGRVTIVQNVPGLAGVTGSGTLAELQFHVIGAAGDESVIDLQNGLLGDNAAVAIAATWVDGQVTVSGEPPPGAVVVSIDAPPEVALDSDFTAEVDIADVENFDAAQYDVVFDDTVLRLDDVTAGVIDGTAIPVVSNLVDGRVTIVQNVPGLAGVTGSGTLAELQFHVIGAAGDESVIDLQNGLLGDNAAVAIAATWVDGTVTVADEAPLEEVVVSIDAPAEVDADTDFTAEVDIADVENFDAAQYDVVFDDTVLRLDGVTAGAIDGTAIPVVSNLVDGRVTIVQNVPGLAGVTGSGTLAELQFHVIGAAGDESVIDLQNGLLGDNAAVAIAATWVDGTVTVGIPVPVVFDETFGPTALAEGIRSGVLTTIPGGATNVEITLSTAASPGPDMDLELWDDTTHVIGWKAIIDSAGATTGTYEGDTFSYSGWDGGEEYIRADSVSQPYDLKVFAYEAGTYTVDVYYVMPGPDVTPPVITITAPDGTVGSPVTITVSATDPSGVAWIWFGVWPDEYVLTGTEADYMQCVAMASGPGGEVILTFTPFSDLVGTYYVAAWASDTLGHTTAADAPVTAPWVVTE